MSLCSDEDRELEKKREWLDREIENLLQQKQKMENLQVDLKNREEILKQKEYMLTERKSLEMKKLRSSQIISKVRYTIPSAICLGVVIWLLEFHCHAFIFLPGYLESFNTADESRARNQATRRHR